MSSFTQAAAPPPAAMQGFLLLPCTQKLRLLPTTHAHAANVQHSTCLLCERVTKSNNSSMQEKRLMSCAPPYLAVAAAWPEAAVTPHAALDLPAGLPVSGATAAGARAGGWRGCRSGAYCVLVCFLAREEARWQQLSLVLQESNSSSIFTGYCSCIQSQPSDTSS
jgi:hypothetical protein